MCYDHSDCPGSMWCVALLLDIINIHLYYLCRCVVGYCGHEEYFAAIGDIECEAGRHGAAVCQVGRYVDICIYVSKYLHRTCCWGTSAAMTSAAPHWAEYRGDAAVTKQGSYRPARTWGTRRYSRCASLYCHVLKHL